jgi:hypothetical protein
LHSCRHVCSRDSFESESRKLVRGCGRQQIDRRHLTILCDANGGLGELTTELVALQRRFHSHGSEERSIGLHFERRAQALVNVAHADLTGEQEAEDP